jgi:hypothetical protein
MVSARDLYGEIPTGEIPSASPEAKLVRSASARIADGEVLIPKKPAANLWANGAGLPEEKLPVPAAPNTNYFAASRPGKNSGARIKSVQGAAERAKKNTSVDSNANVDYSGSAERRADHVAVPPKAAAPGVIRSMPRYAPAKKAPVPQPDVRPADDADEKGDEFSYKGDVPLTKLSPAQLKRAFKKTFTVENKHLSTYQIDDGFDEASFDEGEAEFDSSRDLSEQGGGIRPLEIKIGFHGDDSALSRDNYNLLAEYAGIVAANPKRAIQISIPERSTRSYDGRKVAARRLTIIEQVLKDSGIIDRRIIPVLSQRSDDSFVLRVISGDTFQTLSEKKRDMFGDTIGTKTYKSMRW